MGGAEGQLAGAPLDGAAGSGGSKPHQVEGRECERKRGREEQDEREGVDGLA